MEKIINFCPTGTQSSKVNSLAPIHINEIIDDVLLCAEAGITIAHIHARDEQEKNTYKKEVFQKIIEGVKKHQPDLLISASLSGRYFQEKSLRTEVLSLNPDFGSLTMSSLNFPNSASVNDPETILLLIEEMKIHGVMPEIECFDAGMLNYTSHLQKKGILYGPLYINIILGNMFNAGTDLSSVADIINKIPKDSVCCFGGIGKEQLKANILGLLEADGVRVGLEDNFYYQEKTKATNIELVKRIHRIATELNFAIMDAKTLRTLGYGNQLS
jgi:uncharacterized protein (DUF849 family)